MEIIYILLTIILIELSYLVAISTKKSIFKSENRSIFVDTSVLIDGRITAIARSGFIVGALKIPRSVVGELQLMADGSDAEKRTRARFGLDVIAELQQINGLDVEIFQDGSRAQEGVDERLLNLAKKYNGIICTIDYNLNKVAKVEEVTVINVNDLAMALKMAYLPGEKMFLELTQKGHDPRQAVGHLPDGTMVVVENASDRIGKTIEVEFIRSLQTAAGKMMFAKVYQQKKSKMTNEKVTNIQNKRRNHTQRPELKLAEKGDSKSQVVTESKPKRFNAKNGRNVDREQNVINLINNNK